MMMKRQQQHNSNTNCNSLRMMQQQQQQQRNNGFRIRGSCYNSSMLVAVQLLLASSFHSYILAWVPHYYTHQSSYRRSTSNLNLLKDRASQSQSQISNQREIGCNRLSRLNDNSNNVDSNELVENDNEQSTNGIARRIYSMPALYDLAFGYRDYEEEVLFLLNAHWEYNKISMGNMITNGDTGPVGSMSNNGQIDSERDDSNNNLRILELAAGPARHSISALSMDSPAEYTIDWVQCIDTSNEMKTYSTEIAQEQLTAEQNDLFHYDIQDMQSFHFDGMRSDESDMFDTVWILLGSLQHLQTNGEVIQCFTAINNVLKPGGTVILELPHPKEVFKMGECTRNGWEVPLEDDEGAELGTLDIVWGDDGDIFDPITQVRQFTISLELNGIDESDEMKNVKEIVPMRLYTNQEIDALARCSNLEMVAQFGALEDGISVDDEDIAYRLVCILRKPLR